MTYSGWRFYMDTNVTKDDVVEGRNKYGSWDDDIDELAAAIDGREPGSRSNNRAAGSAPASDAVDEGFWRATRSQSKYGG
jgi:hypothetical protein